MVKGLRHYIHFRQECICLGVGPSSEKQECSYEFWLPFSKLSVFQVNWTVQQQSSDLPPLCRGSCSPDLPPALAFTVQS